VAVNRFLVVVHDVAPLFTSQLWQVVRELRPLLGHRFSAAVVPSWHGGPSGASIGEYQELLNCFGERILHGWTHQSQRPNGLLSFITGQADEFRGLTSSIICERVRSAQTAFIELTGQPAWGLVPPVWQLPIPSTELDCVRFVMRFQSLESCHDPSHIYRLSTWSWDWGRFGFLAAMGELLGRIQRWKVPHAIPCIAIHPIDVNRGWFKNALGLVQELLDQNYVPALGSELFSCAEVKP
jgi:predicted deacetylase